MEKLIFIYVHKELSKVGVTEVLLWEEYCEKCKKEDAEACSYPTFARGYKRYTVSKNYTSHIEHKPGVTLEVDWSGPTMSYIDPDKNTECTAYLFVATFPYSQYTYVISYISRLWQERFTIIREERGVTEDTWRSYCNSFERNLSGKIV